MEKTSDGIFVTTKVRELEVSFPQYSWSKKILVTPDIVDVPANYNPPAYDLIIGVETQLPISASYSNK